MSYLEENTRYIFTKVWRKIFFPVLFSEFMGFLCSTCGAFFLLSRYASRCDLVVFSIFTPFFAIEKVTRNFFSDGGAQYFSFKKGEKNLEGAQHVFSEIITCYGTFFLPVMGLCIWRMENIVKFLKIQPDWIPLAVRYGRLFLLALCFFCLTNILQRFLTSDSMPGFSAFNSFVNSVLNVVGSIVVIGVFRKGVMGYAYANLVICALSLIICLIPFFCRMTTIKIKFRWMRFRTAKMILKLVIGSVIAKFIYMGCSVWVNRCILMQFTPAAVTIMTLCFVTIDNFNSVINHAYRHPFILITSMFLGERNVRGVRMAFRRALTEGLTVKCLMALAAIFLAPVIVFLFPVPEAFPGEAVFALRVFSFAPVFYFINDMVISYFGSRGLAKFITFGISIPQNIISVSVIAFFIFVAKSEWIFWFCHPTRLFIEMLFILLSSYIYSRHKGYKNILMLKDDEKNFSAYHFLISEDNHEFSDYRNMLKLFLHKNFVAPHSINQISLLFEELYVFAKEHGLPGKKKKVAIQINTPLTTHAELSVRFECKGKKVVKLFDSSLQHIAPEQIAGGQILANMSDTIYIDRICGFIYIRLTKKLQFLPGVNTDDTEKSTDGHLCQNPLSGL